MKLLKILFPIWYNFIDVCNIQNRLEIIEENNYELAKNLNND